MTDEVRTGVASALALLATPAPRRGDWVEAEPAFADLGESDVEEFVHDVADTLDLTDEELVVALILLEAVLRRAGRASAPADRACSLFLAAAVLAYKSLSDFELSLCTLSKALAILGYDVSARRLARMERLALKALDHRVDVDAETLETYMAAVREEGRRVSERPRGEEA